MLTGANMKSIFLSITIFLILAEILNAQNEQGSLMVGMPSPNAASLGKYGDVPVGFHTGTPQINIPVHTVSGRVLTVPISVSYHASGLKVEDFPSWVGLGWSLSAGGVITRSMRGVPDDGFFGYLETGRYIHENWDDIPGGLPPGMAESWAEGLLDPAPDQFFFNFAGRSGKFNMESLDHQGAAIVESRSIPHEKLKIEYEGPVISTVWNTTIKHVKKWIITDERGMRYIFDALEATRMNVPYSYSTFQYQKYVSSWYLTSVESPSGNDVILFEYTTPVDILYEMHPSEEHVFDISGCVESWSPYTDQNYRVNTIYLSKITSAKEEVEFLTSGIDEQQLDRIRVRSKHTGDIVKEFELSYSGAGYLRTLAAITEVGQDGSALPPHLFEYDGVKPLRSSYAIDYWGYNNGKETNNRLMPDFAHVYYDNGVPEILSYDGADKEPNADEMKKGLLKKIIYPTGGETEFEFEPHDYGMVGTEIVNNTLEPHVQWLLADGANGPVVNSFDFTLTHDQQLVIWQSHSLSRETHFAYLNRRLIQIYELDASGNEIQSVYRQDYSSEWGEEGCFDPPSLDEPCPPGSWTFTEEKGLFAGDYRVYVESHYGPDNGLFPHKPGTYDATQIKLAWYEQTTTKTKVGGGVRLKSLKTYDGISHDNDLVRTYDYTLAAEPDRSSGVLVNEPRYHYWGIHASGCTYVSLTSVSRLVLGTSQGSYVGYREVRENYGNDSRYGFTIYEFLAANTYPDQFIGTDEEEFWPFGLKKSQDWKRGHLISQKEFNQSDVIQRHVQHAYSFGGEADPTTAIHRGVNVKKINFSIGQVTGATYVSKFEIISGWMHPVSETVTLYDQNGQNPVTTVEVFKYDNPSHLQLTGMEETNSDGTKRVSEITYAHEIPEYSGMAEANMITQVGQQTVYEDIVTGGSARSSSVSTWKEWQPGKWSEKGSYAWREDDNPVSLPTFDGWVTEPSDPEWILRESVETVDDFGRPTSVKDALGVVSSVLWGHEKNVPIGIARGVGYGTHEDGWPREFGYSGFESSNGLVFDGGWNNAALYSTAESFTGKASALVSTQDGGQYGPTMDFAIQNGLQNNTVYVISCWVKTSSANAQIVVCKNNSSDYVIKGVSDAIKEVNGWKLIQFDYPYVQGWTSSDFMRVFPSNDNTTPAYFDDIRVYPEEAMLITQTYDPATLLPTSQSDGNSIPASRYSFDGFQRLIEIRDAYGLVSSRYGYHYQSGPGDHNYVKSTVHPNGDQGEPAITVMTWFDGLGKEMQSLTNNEAGDGSVVVHSFYDERGRPVVKTKPIEVLPSDIPGYQTLDFVDPLELVDSLAFRGASDVSVGKLLRDKTGDARAYEKVNYFPEPGSRSMNVRPFGKDFHTGNHYVKTSYWTSIADNLTFIRQEDEDGDIRKDYMDFFGNVVKQSTDMDPASDLVTFFDYDVLGNLLNSTAPNGAVTTYNYNTMNLLASKSSTDEGTIDYLYDRSGRARLIQDQNHKDGYGFGGGVWSWLFLKYDALGRMIQQGEYQNTAGYTNQDLQGFIDDDGMTYDPYELEGGNRNFPTATAEMLYTSYQFYDDYLFDNAPLEGSDLTGPFQGYDDNAIGRLTKTLTLEPVTGDFIEQVFFYDVYGRITTKLVFIPEIGAKEIRYSYDASGRVLKLSYQKDDPEESLFQWFEYDNLSRIREVYSHTVDDRNTAVREAQYFYDDANGKVRQLILGNGVQTVDYVYTIRDWLKSINDPNALGSDKFGMILSYYDSDAGSASPARYDGNIRAMKWKTEGHPVSGYDYTYDKANRLIHGDFQDAGKYSERAISYDPAGNILSLTRHNKGVPATLTYQYDGATPRPNRLLSVSGGLNANYDYDGNGNMTLDDSKGDFIYDYRNMPVQIDLNGTGQNLILSYDAAGQRYRKLVRDSGGNLEPGSRLYVRGIDDNIIAEYAPGGGSWSVDHYNLYGTGLIGKIQMVPATLQLKDGSLNGTQTFSAESEIVVDPEFGIEDEVTLEVGAEGIEGRYYYLKDHLGSTRGVMDDDGNLGSRSDYYPFGANHAVSTWGFNTSEGFTGKQLDEGLDLVYFGARYFSTVIGRWSSVDPLDEKYADLSPYHYSLNNPINYYDPDGNHVVSDDGKTARRTGLDDARFRALGEVSAYWQALSILMRELESDPSDMALPIEYASAAFGVFGGVSVRGAKRALKMSGNFLASFAIDYGRFSISRMLSAAIEKEIDNIDALYMDKKTFEVAQKLGIGTFKFGSNDEVLEISDKFLDGMTSRGSKAAVEVTKKLGDITAVLQSVADNNGFDFKTAKGRDGFSEFLQNNENMAKVLEAVQSLK